MLKMAFWKKSEPGFSWNKLKSWKLFHETKNDSQIIFFDFVGYKDFLYIQCISDSFEWRNDFCFWIDETFGDEMNCFFKNKKYRNFQSSIE